MKSQLIAFIVLFSINGLSAITIKQGVIRESTCNLPSGLGYLKLEQKVNNKIIFKGMKVNSKKLCAAAPGDFTFLGNLGFDAVFLGETKLFEVKIENDFIVDAKIIKNIDYLEFHKNIKQYVYEDSLNESFMWFHSGPTYISFYLSNEKINSLIEKYTSQYD